MFLRALALFVTLNSIYLSSGASIAKSWKDGDCYVLKDADGNYLALNRDNNNENLVLLNKPKSTFRFEATGEVNKRDNPIYKIFSCDKDTPISWSKSEPVNTNDINYFVFARKEDLSENFLWVVVEQDGSQFLQILDAHEGLSNLYSTKVNGEQLPLVYGAEWPDSFSEKENSKPFWTIEAHPGEDSDEDKDLTQDQEPGNDKDSEDSQDTEEDKTPEPVKKEKKKEGIRALSATFSDFVPWIPNAKECYLIKQTDPSNGQTYSMALGTVKGVMVDGGNLTIMDQTPIRKAKTWRFQLFTSPSSRNITRYNIINCDTPDNPLEITVGYVGSSLFDGEVVAAEVGSYQATATSWRLFTNNAGQFVIQDFYSQSNYLSVRTDKVVVSNLYTGTFTNDFLLNIVEYSPYP